MILSACSSKATVLTTPIICPAMPLCELPKVRLKTNGDLALALAQSQRQIKQCQLQIKLLEQCINQFNEKPL